MKKHLFFLATTTFLASSVFGQSYEHYIQGTGNDAAFSTELLNNNGIILGGATNTAGSGGQDMMIMRLDAAGNEIWTKAVGTPQPDTCIEVIITTDSFIVACGSTYGGGLGSSDLYINKLDMNGQLIWTKVYGTAAYDFSVEAFATRDSGFILVGYVDHPAAFTPVMGASCNSFMMKCDRNGNIVWTQYYASLSCHNKVYDAVQYPNGDFVLLIDGYCQSSPPNYFSQDYIVRTDSMGQIKWRKKNFGFVYDFVMIATNDNGTQFVYTTGAGQVQTLKIDSMGVPLSSFNYGYFTSMAVSSAFEMSDGGLLMTGYVQPDQFNPLGFLFFRTGANGYPMWTKFQRQIEPLYFFVTFDTKLRSDNLYSTMSTVTGNLDGGIALLLTDSTGQTICGNDSDMVVYTNTLTLPTFTDEPQVNTPPTLLTGTSLTNVVDFNFTFGSLCGSNPGSVNDVSGAQLDLQVVPNPAENELNIQWDGMISGELRITNALGELVHTQNISGTRSTADVSDLAPGLYMVSILENGTVKGTARVMVK